MLGNVSGVLRNVPGVLRNFIDVSHNVPGVLRSVLSVLRNVLSVLHNILDVLLGKGLLYTKGGADPTFASAKVKNAIGRIGIFLLHFSVLCNVSGRSQF